MSQRPVLPVDAILPEIVESLKRHPSLVIEASPGAGKTTRVPPALLGMLTGEVIVMEPRRLAARMAARRVASELGEPVGHTVGYQVRFEEKVGPRTRLRFVTEGVLTRRLLSDPTLKGVSAVVLDEFHERHLEGDLALALLKALQRTRTDLRIVIMSATLDGNPIAEYLAGCPVLRCDASRFPVFIEHLPYSQQPVEVQVRVAVDRLMNEKQAGDVLVFLPGAGEIRRAMRECETVARRMSLLLLPLHGSLSPEEQDRAVSPASQQKLILATNVAESSITVEGVTAVIDSGLARLATYSPWTGLPALHVARVSKASAKQRAGRAGRLGAGRVLRLYPEEDYLRRPEHDVPEITRSDLSQLCLTLRALDMDATGSVDWLTAPPQVALRSAELLLDRLGATGEMAHRLARYPLPPRLSRILVAAIEQAVGEDGCIAAALLGADEGYARNDLLAAMEESGRNPRIRQHIEQLRRIARPSKQTFHNDDALLKSILAGFPDRVARLRSGKQVLMSTGASAEVAGDAPTYEFMVAVDAEDRKEKPLPLIRMMARIEPEWLIDLFPERVHERTGVEWNRVTERVEGVSALIYDELVIQESRGGVMDEESAAELLARKAIELGIDRFVDSEALNNFMARVEFAGLEQPDVEFALLDLSRGLKSFNELRAAAKDLIPLLEQKIGARRFNELAPTRIRLQAGRETRVNYERGKPPWIASRLQDFFGMRETPKVGLAQTPVVVHLLAPNRRAVQTTTDLAGFWERLYPQVRRELMRRYPRHSWPERP